MKCASVRLSKDGANPATELAAHLGQEKQRPKTTVSKLKNGLILTASLWPILKPESSAVQGGYRLLTMNMLTYNPRKDPVIDDIVRADPDFVVLQESNLEWIEALNVGFRRPDAEFIACLRLLR